MDIKLLHWAAGFLEGEGSFSFRNRSVDIKASQVQQEPLTRLYRYFGGHLYGPFMNRPDVKIKKRQPFYEWHAGGRLAASLMMTLYPLMSPSRQERIRRALTEWRTVPPKKDALRFCKRGHEFTELNTYVYRGSRVCRKCNRMRARLWAEKKKAVQKGGAHLMLLTRKG